MLLFALGMFLAKIEHLLVIKQICLFFVFCFFVGGCYICFLHSVEFLLEWFTSVHCG